MKKILDVEESRSGVLSNLEVLFRFLLSIENDLML